MIENNYLIASHKKKDKHLKKENFNLEAKDDIKFYNTEFQFFK